MVVDSGRVIRSKSFIAMATPWGEWKLAELGGRSNELGGGGSSSATPWQFEHCIAFIFESDDQTTVKEWDGPTVYDVFYLHYATQKVAKYIHPSLINTPNTISGVYAAI